jgi:MerR family copper efflux transcriptional regulator
MLRGGRARLAPGSPVLPVNVNWQIGRYAGGRRSGFGGFATAAGVPEAEKRGAMSNQAGNGAEISIADACEQTGLSRRTVRYYEELGLLPGVRRTSGGRRVYGPDEVERLLFIQRLKTLGLSLAETKELNAVYAIAGSTGAMLERLDAVLGEHLRGLESRIQELSTLRNEMSKYRDHIGSRIDVLSGSSAKPGRLPSGAQR